MALAPGMCEDRQKHLLYDSDLEALLLKGSCGQDPKSATADHDVISVSQSDVQVPGRTRHPRGRGEGEEGWDCRFQKGHYKSLQRWSTISLQASSLVSI